MGLVPGQMKAKCIDYGQNFLTGQATSILAASGIEVAGGTLKELADNIQDKTMVMVSDLKNTTTKEVAKVGSQIGGMAGDLVGTGLSTMQNAFQSTDLVKLAAGELTTYSMQLLNDASSKIGAMVSSFPQAVLSKASYLAGQEAKEELTKAIQEVMGTPKENSSKEEAKKEKDNKVKKAIKWCSKAIKDANKFKDETLGKLQEDCEDISNLMIQGPEWVNDQLESAVDSAKEYMSTYTNRMIANASYFYTNAVDNSAKAASVEIKSKVIDPTIKKAKEQFNKLGTSTNKTQQKAKAAIQNKLLNLAAKLGISPNG